MNINVSPQLNHNHYTRKHTLSFKGYDARPLKSVVMTVNDDFESFDIIKQMSEIGKKEGFKVYFTNQTNILYDNLDKIKSSFKINTLSYSKWAQDNVVLTPDNRVLYYNDYNSGSGFATRLSNLIKGKSVSSNNLIEGGNLFFVKNGGDNELFVGANELYNKDIESIKKQYGVSKVIAIPQADFHLDMFIRPLNNKRVLVADDRLTIKEIKKAIENIGKYKISHNPSKSEINKLNDVKKGLQILLKDFEGDVKANRNPKADEIAEVLRNSGYKSIMVPSRVYYTIPNTKADDLVHYLNYMNAVVHEKPDGSLIFLTNKSMLNKDFGITPEISDKIGFDFEKMFVKSLEPYVKKENIYFIEGNSNKIAELLKNEGGGIHCLSNEIPAEIYK